jgi:hypothetical protein
VVEELIKYIYAMKKEEAGQYLHMGIMTRTPVDIKKVTSPQITK